MLPRVVIGKDMKTYKNLYPLITHFDNLHLAFKKAARGKRSRSDVATFEFDLERNPDRPPLFLRPIKQMLILKICSLC